MLRQILCVDDEPNLLQGLKRTLGFDFDVHLATSGAEGMEILKAEGPFAAVISDMRMPEMDGARFLAKVKKHDPDTTRLLLTGHSDIEAAIRAVNEGQIFRFLTKPCSQKMLLSSATLAVEQYRLLNVEKELLENTFAASIRVMSQLLELANPLAFGRAARIRSYMIHMAKVMDLSGAWQYEVAASLSQIGCLALDEELVENEYAGRPLSAEEREEFNAHPMMAAKLITQIPRLETVAYMVYNQLDGDKPRPGGGPEAALGAQMMHAAIQLDRMVAGGQGHREAGRTLARSNSYPPAIIDALACLDAAQVGSDVRRLKASELLTGMTLLEDIRDNTGMLFAAAGHQITSLSLARLRAIARDRRVNEPFLIREGP